MRWIFPLLALGVLPWMGVAQEKPTLGRTFRLQNAATVLDANEIFLAARTISDARALETDANARTISLEGTPEDLRLADWVIGQLDQPGEPDLSSPYPLPIQERDEAQVARIFSVPTSKSAQDFNERQTAVRTITDIRRVYPFLNRKLIILRSSKEQADLAEWLLAEMDRETSSGDYEYKPSNKYELEQRENTVHVFHYWRDTPQDFNEAQVMLRTLADIRRVYPFVNGHQIVARGTPNAVKLAGWIVGELQQDLPLKEARASEPFPARLQVTNNKSQDFVAQMFFFPASVAPRTLQDKAAAIRAGSGARSVYPFASGCVIGIVGTPAQVEKAKALAVQ